MGVKKKKTKEDFTQEAYMGIRRMFFLNEIIPGQKISYGDLAKRMNMSTTPVIQALKRLEAQYWMAQAKLDKYERRLHLLDPYTREASRWAWAAEQLETLAS